jgi:ADP-heptose:LPS heptosyltransferase
MNGSSINKALTLRASSLGDCLMGKYFLENIRAQFPGAQCTLLVGSRGNMIQDLLKGYVWLHVLEVNRKDWRGVLKARSDLHGEDITLTQYSERPFSLPSKIFGRFVTKSGGFIGFDDHAAISKILYDRIIPFEGEIHSRGMIIEEQRALEAAGLSLSVPELGLEYVHDEKVLAKFGLTGGQYVLAHLFSGAEGRSFSQQKRIEIVRTVRSALPPDFKIVLTGGPGDKTRADEAAQGLEGVLNITGQTTIQELINLIDNARVIVALDTGAAHIAAHLKKPLAIMTRTEALNGWWGRPMYNDRPHVLCNKLMDDTLPRKEIYPPSLETIDLAIIADTTKRLL